MKEGKKLGRNDEAVGHTLKRICKCSAVVHRRQARQQAHLEGHCRWTNRKARIGEREKMREREILREREREGERDAAI